MDFAPHDFWQTLFAPETFDAAPPAGFAGFYPAALPDGRQIVLPIRVLPGDSGCAVASLIVNQASFAVEDALADAMAGLAGPFAPEVVVGVPTLGLPLANGVARRLGHARMVALGTSKKFWYDEALSEPMASITSPSGEKKRIFLDPRMRPLLAGRRVVVVDDVLSTGASMSSVVRLLAKAGIVPTGIVAAMLQGQRWRGRLAEFDPMLPGRVAGAFSTPLLVRNGGGNWLPDSLST